MISAAGTASTGTARKTIRQFACSTISPAIAGPTSDGTTQPVENAAKTRGRSSGRVEMPDNDVQGDGEQPATESLDHPADDQDLHGRREPGDHQARPGTSRCRARAGASGP